MTTTWILRDPSGTPITPTTAPIGSGIGLNYYDGGTVGFSTTQTVATCECTSDESTITVVLNRGGSRSLDPSLMEVIITPADAPNATWTGNSTNMTVILSFTNPTSHGPWEYTMQPAAFESPQEPIALKVKVVVKRPPEEDRRS